MSKASLIDRIMGTAKSDIEKLLGDEGLEKAAQLLTENEKVMDRWQEGQMHGAATAEEVVVGPEQAATGSNTGKMVREYSNPAPQHGVQLDAQKLMRNLSALGASSKANAEAIGHVADTVKAISAAVTALLVQKAEDEKEEVEKAESSDDDKDFMEKARGKAGALIEQAKSDIARAKALRKAIEDMDEDDDKAEMKAARKKARLLTKSAGVALGKARTQAFVAGDVAMRKSITDIAVKADVDVLEGDEVNEKDDLGKADDEEGMEKANQSDCQDAATGNQAASAKSIDDAMKSIAAIKMTLSDVMNVVSGKARAPVAPEVVKAAVESPASVHDRIADAIDAGSLNQNDAIFAKSVAQMLEGVVKGSVSKELLRSRLDKAPHAVQLLFADHAAAA